MGVIEVNSGTLSGNMTCEVRDVHSPAPTNIIDLNTGWHLRAVWDLSGPMVPMLAGNWKLTAYLESIGPGPEIVVLDRLVPIASGRTGPFQLQYDIDTHISQPNQPTEAGPYKLVVVITSQAPDGTPGAFAAFDEGPILQFYTAP
jgi:hypothetical protein